MANVKQQQLENRVQELEALLKQIQAATGLGQPRFVDDSDRSDVIEHGSPAHVAFLALKPLEEGEVEGESLKAQAHDGMWYTMADRTMFGIAVKEEFLEVFLAQRVNELAGPPPVQSRDPRAPNYAPPMWRPDELPVSGIV